MKKLYATIVVGLLSPQTALGIYYADAVWLIGP